MANATAAGGAQAWRERRHEVEERLRAVGRVERVAPPAGRLGPDERHAERLRGALQSLGPIFAAFGQYLSSRLDLFARRDFLWLSRIRDARDPAAAAQVA